MKGRKAAYWAVLALPPLLALLYIHRFGVNVLFMDEFAMVPLVTRDSLPDLATLFARHNEHRLFFPRIVYYFVARWTDMNSVAVMYCSCLLVGALYCVLVRYVRKTVKSAATVCLLSLATGLVLFHPVQWENILLGFQLAFYMAHIFALLAIFLFFQAEQIAKDIPKNRSGVWGNFALAILCAVVASFSSIQGLLAWPAVVLTRLLANGMDKQEKRRLLLFGIVGIAVWLLYFYGPATPIEQRDIFLFAKRPLLSLEFLLALFGHPYRLNMYDLPYVQGGIVLLLVCTVMGHCYVTRKTPAQMFPVGFIIYGLLAGLSIAVGRCESTLAAVSVSRYSTFTIVLFLGIMLHFFMTDKDADTRHNKWLLVPQVLAVSLAFTLLWNMPAYLHYSKQYHQFCTMTKYYMQTFEGQTDDKLRLLLHKPEWARKFCKILEKFRYNAFADPPVRFDDFWKTAPSSLQMTTVEPIQKDCLGMVSYIDVHESSLLVLGWLIHSLETTQGPQQIVAIVQEHAADAATIPRYYQADRGERQDMALRVSAKQFLHAGFYLTIPGGKQYKVGYFFDDTLYQCNNIQFPTN